MLNEHNMYKVQKVNYDKSVYTYKVIVGMIIESIILTKLVNAFVTLF